MKAWCRKRHWSNVSEVFFQSSSRQARSSEEGEERNSIREEKRRRRLENLPHSSGENDVAFENVALTLGRSNLPQFLCHLSSESDACAGAFRGQIAVK